MAPIIDTTTKMERGTHHDEQIEGGENREIVMGEATPIEAQPPQELDDAVRSIKKRFQHLA